MPAHILKKLGELLGMVAGNTLGCVVKLTTQGSYLDLLFSEDQNCGQDADKQNEAERDFK
jgi:hypothetical protein